MEVFSKSYLEEVVENLRRKSVMKRRKNSNGPF